MDLEEIDLAGLLEDSESSSSESSSSSSESSSSSSESSSSSSSSSESSSSSSESSSSSSSSSESSSSESSLSKSKESTKSKNESQKSNLWEEVEEYYKEQEKFNLKKKEKKNNIKPEDNIEFINKNHTLTAVGKNINIKINKGKFILYDEALKNLENSINLIGNDIIKIKLNILFNLITEEEGIQKFTLKKKEIDELFKKKNINFRKL